MKSVFRIGLCVVALGGGTALAQEREVIRAERGGADEGLYFLLGGGAEVYTGSLAPQLDTAPAYGATLGYKPSQVFGVEVAYSGAASNVDLGNVDEGELVEDASIARNGVQAAATLGITRTQLQPYVMGGVGFESYDIRGEGEVIGFNDDTNGYIPAGAGLRYQLGNFFTADARVSYNLPFGQDFAPGEADSIEDGRFQGLLQVGGTF